jgi:aldehyde dehydrogenase (NAD+)
MPSLSASLDCRFFLRIKIIPSTRRYASIITVTHPQRDQAAVAIDVARSVAGSGQASTIEAAMMAAPSTPTLMPAVCSPVDAAVRRLFSCAAWADKWDGAVHHTPFRTVTMAMPEPLGVVAVAAPDHLPLLGLVSTVGPLVAMGNAVIVVPGSGPLVATDFYQVLDTSDVPGGVINILTGHTDELVETLAGHYDVDGVWYFGAGPGGAMVERLSADNMKRVWVDRLDRDWFDPAQGEGPEFLRRATQVKNIWVPYGE